MSKELIILGPPGTGKTTRMAAGAVRAAQSYGGDKVMILSLTKAAAREAAGRDTPLPPENIGTMHAICHRAFDRPALLKPAHIRDWNTEHPQWKLPPDIVTGSDEGDGSPPGESMYQDYQLARARMTDRRLWPAGMRAFAAAWEDFKENVESWDFTDLIERALHEIPYAPGRPRLLLGDEAQDFSRLEVALFRRWAQHCDSSVLTGDPLQAIFDWRGADQHVFHNPHAEREVLCETTPSYRCPRAVWRRATALASDLLAREGVTYQPRDAEGAVTAAPRLVDWRPDGEPCMLMATCDYLLSPIRKRLRREGLPYHNPFARGWNPLRMDGTAGTLLALAAPERGYLDWGALRRVLPALRAELFRGRKKAAIESLPEDDDCTVAAARAWMLEHLHPAAVDGLGDAEDTGDPTWYIEHATSSFQKLAQYPAAVIGTVGAVELRRQMMMPARDRPWWVLGTIHSFKGGEADRVVVWPDLSPQFFKQGRQPGWHGREALVRLFYVAMTRAREELMVGTARGGLRMAM